MNILYIATTYPTPTSPRQGMFNRNLVDALRQRHDVRVIAPVPWVQRLRPLGSGSVHHQSPHDFHPTYVYPPKLMRSRYDDFYWQSILPALKQIEASFTPDLVMGYWLHPDGRAAERAALHFKSPCVVFSGGSDLRLLPRNSARRHAIRKVLADADRLVVVSRDLAARAINLGMPADKIDVVYRGVDQHCFHPRPRRDARAACGLPDDGIALMWSGRLEPVKNPTLLFRAAQRWRQRWGDRLKIMIAGDGSMRKDLIKLRSQLNLDSCVRFEGNLSQQELAVRYNAADVMVLTSHSEGVPNVLLESIACDVPFVATDVGGVSEIATPGIDRLVPDNDLDRLVDAVVRQAEQPVESPSQFPRAFVPDGLPQMAARFEAVFRRTLAVWNSKLGKAG
ncbi:Putative teichuronic acid biosynthesis glycosyltransferase TuaC [Stieleria maiorica]|uniref:Teichuronic acid biosynthesis glycosyltransferase TuaC n=1 Tax=Stieleria maiorica TaxID=2795974 RepID=A0A5B9MLH7_9BACT|nr:glycosyltransferase [Stieleria maiorica]QEG02189.1 Putative teichuronic acid biosynthesis glycosyltransferase TuaC [Stieleria maiorica]